MHPNKPEDFFTGDRLRQSLFGITHIPKPNLEFIIELPGSAADIFRPPGNWW
jgi:hypothetical protein